MPRRKKARYGREMRARAADLFEAGLGFELAAKKLDVPAPAVRKWLYAVSANLKLTTFANASRRMR